MSEVSTLLARSRADHAKYQQANRDGDKAREKIAISQAKILREQAHALDTAHEDGGWVEDVVSHEAFSDFYEAYLREATTH